MSVELVERHFITGRDKNVLELPNGYREYKHGVGALGSSYPFIYFDLEVLSGSEIACLRSSSRPLENFKGTQINEARIKAPRKISYSSNAERGVKKINLFSRKPIIRYTPDSR